MKNDWKMGSTNVEWYHGKISRNEAENLLKNSGTCDGTFLVRESNTSPGDFVLSVLANDEIIHYQIRQHFHDAFFSIDENNVIHGLDSLVEHYQQTDPNLTPHLTKPVQGQQPPPHTRRHGKTNLLHRATESSDFNVIREILNCGYQGIAAKNPSGQTATHIAIRNGNDEILRALIEKGASINCRDIAGRTPLHYACQSNRPSIVKLLILEGHADIQTRNHDTNWVPLHEAASRGFCEVVQTLLVLNAPPRPRTAENQTPEDLAMQNRHYECAKLLREYKQPAAKTDRELWYHGTLDRNEATKLLEGQPDGTYLVRWSDRLGGAYKLSMVVGNKTYHYIIERKDNFYFIDQGPYFETLEHVIEYYSNFSDGLHTTLQFPIKPEPKPQVPDFSTIPRHDRITFRGPLASPTSPSLVPAIQQPLAVIPTELVHVANKRVNLNEDSSIYDDFIPKDCLTFGRKIGEGEFALVCEGTYTVPGGNPIRVAIKQLNHENIETDRENFLREAKVMSRLKHHCIVKLIGLCNDPCLMMIQEYVELGSMLSYLKNNATAATADFEFYIWAAQIACGMIYLEQQQFVHRDLAARNILLASKHQAKISDFGLSRALETSDYYKALKGGKWPVRWYAPESYNYGTFSHASDVWSFGVMLWEMFTFGEQPFGDLKGVEVIKLIDKGERLPQPQYCPNNIYKIMMRCWQRDPLNRPTFHQLKEFFSSEPGYTNVRELINTDIN